MTNWDCFEPRTYNDNCVLKSLEGTMGSDVYLLFLPSSMLSYIHVQIWCTPENVTPWVFRFCCWNLDCVGMCTNLLTLIIHWSTKILHPKLKFKIKSFYFNEDYSLGVCQMLTQHLFFPFFFILTVNAVDAVGLCQSGRTHPLPHYVQRVWA